MINSKKFNTAIIDLKSVSEKRFVIPTYQRPYVWKEEQVINLLNGCIGAFLENKDSFCFIGTVLTSDKQTHYELIDGQQRFTTLWLIAVVFDKLKVTSELVNFLKCGEKLRLGFEIRKEVEQYFELLEVNPSDALKKYTEVELEESIYLKDISKALSIIEGIITSSKSDFKQDFDLKSLGDYFYNNVKMINNITPDNINLNKLFETINNSGVQLEQTDIVKANLLKKIISDKLKYSKIWEACENMNDFFERNVRKIFTETNWNQISIETFSKFESNVFNLKAFDEEQHPSNLGKNTIRYFLDNPYEDVSTTIFEEEEKTNEIYARSIISFGQLLLHTYRIYLYKKNKSDFVGIFHVNRLIEIFKTLESDSEDNVKYFFELLWQVRYTFDKYVIKWVTDLDSKTEHLELTNISEYTKKNVKYFGRNVRDKSDELMLQSVMYFTGDYLRQYWLTPFLYILMSNCSDSIGLLEKIDNYMSLSKKTDAEISWDICNSSCKPSPEIELCEELGSAKGTEFRHYWFQKLEYILWKDWDKNDPKLKNFRITSKNSVEHVFPQKHEFKNHGIVQLIDVNTLNSFGNLGLLSVSQNSSYSNQDVQKKKIDFDNKGVYDSLKLALIYNSLDISIWNNESIYNHQVLMIDKFINHYKQI